MTKRFYYNCPIKALYMMREFGVEFVTKRGNRYSEKVIAEFVHDSCYGEIEDDAFYVAKESEEIFRAKEGDFVTNSLLEGESRHCHGFVGPANSLMSDVSLMVITPERHNGKSYFVESKSQLTVIMRNNKQFFTGFKK